jgi:hypothetical protein
MIWQLMKRDMAMKTAPMMAIIFALIAVGFPLLPVPRSGDASLLTSVALGGIVSYLGFLIWLGMNSHSFSALYEAALPIAGRDLWLARVLSLLAIIWISILAALAGGLPRLPLLAVAAAFTAFILGVKCVRIRQLGAPKSVRTAAFQVAILGVIGGPYIARYLKAAHWRVLPSPVSVLAICVPASVALFWWGWTSVPKSFQVAPPGEVDSAPVPRHETAEPSGFGWSPVLLAIYGGQSILIMFAFVVGWMASGHHGVGVLAVITQNATRGRCRWLLSLPVSRRKLFGLIALTMAAATMLGSVVSIFVQTKHPLSPRVRFVEFAAEIATVYFVLFLAELPAWSRLSKLPAWVRWAPFLLSFVAVAFCFSDMTVFERLAATLPQAWWQLTPLLAIPTVATYWLAEKAFIEQEYRQLYIEKVNFARGRNSL